MRVGRAGLTALALGGALASSALAQVSARKVGIRPQPAVPVHGTIARVVVTPDSTRPDDVLLEVKGDAAGEPLHFESTATGFAALFGVPLEGGDSLPLELWLVWEGRTDTTRLAFPLAQPSLRTERLRVPPAMVNYDSATLARIDSELARAVEVSRRSHETPRLWSGRFRLPRATRITSVYGTAREYNGEIKSRHMGTDFAGRVGEPVSAAARGRVALAADFYLAGRALYLDHGAGVVTGYFHLSRIDVAEGQMVEAGQVVGRVGRSGRVTGPHLHWIVRYGRITIDPLSLVGMTDSLGRAQENGAAIGRRAP